MAGADRVGVEEAVRDRAGRDPGFRAHLLADPAGALAEVFGVRVPADVRLRVVEEGPREVVLVLPAARPPGAIAETDLAAVAGGMWTESILTCTNRCCTEAQACATESIDCPWPI